MYYFLHELCGAHLGVVVALPVHGDAAHVDGLFGAVLQAAEALDTVCPEAGLSALQADIPSGAELCALSAADAVLGHTELLGLEFGQGGPGRALQLVQQQRAGVPGQFLACQHIHSNLSGQFFGPGLGLIRPHRRQHQLVGEEPDAGALVRYPRPVVQTHNAVDDAQAHAGVARVAAHGKLVGLAAHGHVAHILLHSSGQAPGVAGKDKAHPLRLPGVGDGRGSAHHHDIRIAQFFRDVLCDVQAVTAA